jgi:anhydro-N-acetylmuramic acid kinase
MKVIGLISGTSHDAIEAVATTITLRGQDLHVTVLAHVSVAYDEALRRRIAAALPPASTSFDEVCQLDTAIGRAFADVASDLNDRFFHGLADVVGSHGQTAFHWVDGGRVRGTLQVGQPAWIAESTGATVVADVRARDITLGGQGAPLVSLLDVLLLGARTTATGASRTAAALNLGGIANLTVVAPDVPPIAFDVGPANALLDAATAWTTNGADAFDRDGARAARGTVNRAMLDELLREPYYALSPPKSTGKELFNLTYVRHHLGNRDLVAEDLLATLSELTAATVADAVRAHDVDELFVSGGGLHNSDLMTRIRRRLDGVRVSSTHALGIDPDAKEAVLIAVIGFLTVHGLTGTIPSCTGARRASVLGTITPGRRQPRRLSEAHQPRTVHVSTPGLTPPELP